MRGFTQYLPVCYYPREEELLSSWLVRLAHSNGKSAQRFLTELLGSHRSTLWQTDIDSCHNQKLINSLQQKTTISYERIHSTTLNSYEGWLVEHFNNAPGTTKWILPLGIKAGRWHLPALQYCPTCLLEDKVPYFRKRWRLAWVTTCVKHGRYLHNCCPYCSKPISFHLFDHLVGYRSFWLPVCHCGNCGFDLRYTHNISSLEAPPLRLIHFQTYLEDMLSKGWVEIPMSSWTYSFAYFETMHHLLILIITRKIVLRDQDIPIFIGKGDRASFEKLTVKDRGKLVVIISSLLADWPRSFLQLCHSDSTTSSSLLGDHPLHLPYWYFVIIDTFYNHSWYRPSEKEIAAATNYLISQRMPPTHYNVRKALGFYYPSNTNHRSK